MVVDIVVVVVAVAVGVVVLVGNVVDIAIEVEGSCPTLGLGRGLVDIEQVVGTEPAMGQASVDQLPHSRRLLDLTTYLSEQHFAVAIVLPGRHLRLYPVGCAGGVYTAATGSWLFTLSAINDLTSGSRLNFCNSVTSALMAEL